MFARNSVQHVIGRVTSSQTSSYSFGCDRNSGRYTDGWSACLSIIAVDRRAEVADETPEQQQQQPQHLCS